jgi:hypothetical protein
VSIATQTDTSLENRTTYLIHIKLSVMANILKRPINRSVCATRRRLADGWRAKEQPMMFAPPGCNGNGLAPQTPRLNKLLTFEARRIDAPA